MQFYEVVSLLRGSQRDSTLTYHADEEIPVGSIVSIPFGKRETYGVIVGSGTKPEFETKAVKSTVYPAALSSELVQTLLWIADYYSTPLNTVFSLVIPKGIEKKRRQKSLAQEAISRPDAEITLTPDQKQVIEAIQSDPKVTHLLQGVTGSGKTQVYIELAKQAADKGRSAIVLVPEISLTTQIVGDFKNSFENVIVTHSAMTESQRHAVWNELAQADSPTVVIGPRSALFAPIKNVGLIVIDESHEDAYKQDTAPRYDARRVARVLATGHKATLVLGSATPNVADRFLADKRGKIHTLAKTISSAAKVDSQVIDLNNRDYFTQSKVLSNQLIEALKETHTNGKQSMIFHNRRGTATIGLCSNCGWTAQCPNCEVPLTLHKDSHELRCHICAYAITPPSVCPDCSSGDILFKGFGTKRVVEEIEKFLPGARIIRFDADNTKDESLAKMYQAVHDGEYDVIVGTQIVAKGLDLPNLETVGVISAESSLHLPDFAASERTYQLLTQVIGRAGRREASANVIIQAHQPDSPLLSMVTSGKFEEFYASELARREHLLYPPFTYLLQLTCSYSKRDAAEKAARAKTQELESISGIEVLGPTPAFYEKRANRYRWTLVIKSRKRERLLEIANDHTDKYWVAELDPISLLT